MMPHKLSWWLANGMGNADVFPAPFVPFPDEVGHAQVGYQPLDGGSAIFDISGETSVPVTVEAEFLLEDAVLTLRLPSSGRTLYQPPGGAGPLEESAENYSLHLLDEARSLAVYQSGSPVVSLIPVLTIERVRAMVGDDGVPVPVRRFLDGHERNFSALLRTSPAMRHLIAQFRANPYDGAMASLYAQGKVCEMLAEAFSDLAGTVTEIGRVAGPDHRRAMAARDLLMTDPADPPAMEALANQVGLSPRHLNELFRDIFGMTVFEWLVDWRLHQARDLLLEGSLPVKEVASRLGYAHVSNFTRVFTRRFGIPPAAWRKATRSVHALSGNPG